LRPTIEHIVEKRARLDPHYNKFLDAISNTKPGFDMCQRLEYARAILESALLSKTRSRDLIDRYRMMLSVIAADEHKSAIFMSNSLLISDIDRLVALIENRFKMIMEESQKH
jgi:hypothetical protein